MQLDYQISVSNINHDDIVNFLASSVEASHTVGIRYDKELWKSLPEDQKTEDPCIEDICADLLLAGKYIWLFDPYYEDNEEDMSKIRKGEVSSESNVFGDFLVMRYKITLQDFLDALNTDEGGYCAKAFDEGEDDLCTSENLLQMVMFGEIIYG